MELFKLVGKIFVDSKEANESISKTGKNADGLGNKLASGVKTAAGWAAGIGAAAAAVGGAMVAAAKDTAKATDTIDKASQRMKIGAEAYQELAYAANLSGVEMSTLEKAAKKLEGTDLNFDEAITQIMSISDESERAAAAAEMFGESVAYQMTPLLNAGEEGLAAMRQEANDLGLVMSQDSVTAGASMNDMFTKLDATFNQVKNSIMVELMPYVMEILQWCIDNLPKIAETVKSVMDRLMPIIEPALNAVLALVKMAFDILNGDFDGFINDAKALWENLKAYMEGLVDLFWDIGSNIIDAVLNGMKAAWTGLSSWVSEKAKDLANTLNPVNLISGIGKALSGSHASGLAYVPYDGYTAQLHRGEMVLNQTDANELISTIKDLTSQRVNVGTQAIYLDSGVLVGQIAPGIDRNLGVTYAVNKRGALA